MTHHQLWCIWMLCVARWLRVHGFQPVVRPTTTLVRRSATTKPKKKEDDVITPQKDDYGQWYLDVIAAGDLVDQSPVKGCMVIRPWGMAIWELLQKELDSEIKKTGAENAYFPLLIPQHFLSKEADHVEGFAKECAVVTHHRLRASDDGIEVDPDAELEEPLIIRPTSETMIWHMFGKWINSYRDLPLKINQWANVLRWEMRTRPFLRSAEFLWQEGHTAHASEDDAVETARRMLDIYADVTEKILAVPVVKGRKTATERFAGAEDTYTIEAQMPNGWALQSGTSHFLGQNFARAFDVFFQTKDGKTRDHVWATSWGVSTRLLGALVMTHSDDLGLKLPPNVAPVQVVIVPVAAKKPPDVALVNKKIDAIVTEFQRRNIRYKIDDRDYVRPGAKFFEWERKGVPLRVEIGPRDATNDQCLVVPRWSSEVDEKKITVALGDVASDVDQRLQDLQSAYFTTAQTHLETNCHFVTTYDDLKARIDQGGFVLAPWTDDAENEAAVKTDCKATIRCFPFDPAALCAEATDLKDFSCFYSHRPATHFALFARAF